MKDQRRKRLAQLRKKYQEVSTRSAQNSGDRYQRKWRKKLKLLKNFIEREGHVRVPPEHLEDGVKLCDWVQTQRRRKEELHPKQRAALEGLDGWSWKPNEDKWSLAFRLLKKFVKGEGHALVPHKHIEDGFPLGQWVINHRRFRNTMPVSRRHSLDSLEGWCWNALDGRWSRMVGCLKKFVEREGHIRVPLKYTEDGLKLGQWVPRQRRSKEGMSVSRRKTLEKIPGWEWSSK